MVNSTAKDLSCKVDELKPLETRYSFQEAKKCSKIKHNTVIVKQ